MEKRYSKKYLNSTQDQMYKGTISSVKKAMKMKRFIILILGIDSDWEEILKAAKEGQEDLKCANIDFKFLKDINPIELEAYFDSIRTQIYDETKIPTEQES